MAKAPTTTAKKPAAKKAPAKSTLPSSKVEINLTAGSTDAAMKAAEAKAGKLWNVPIASIKPIPGFNVRVDSADYRAHRDALAISIRENGFNPTKPLAGYVAKEGDENVIYVTDGYTRLDAANIVNKEDGKGTVATLPVVVRPSAPSLDDLTVELHTSNNGRSLTPFELGVVAKRMLRAEGAKKAAVARRLSISARYLDDVLLLVNSPKPVREAVLEGKVASTLAIQELRRDPEEAEARLTGAIEKAAGSAKSKVTSKDVSKDTTSAKVKMNIVAGMDMKELVKLVASEVRKAVPHTAGDGDDGTKEATSAGFITLSIALSGTKPKAAKPAAAKKAPTKKPAAKEPEADTEKARPKRRKAKPADDLGIKGAEPLSDDDLDNEPARTPPVVKSDDGEEEVDI